MINESVHIRGLNKEYLDKMRIIVKTKYGKTKDRDGSITTRIINGLLFNFLKLCAEDPKILVDSVENKKISHRKRVILNVLEVAKEKDLSFTKHSAAIVQTIRLCSGVDDFRRILDYIRIMRLNEYITPEEEEILISAAYTIYGRTRREKKETENKKETKNQKLIDKDKWLLNAMQKQVKEDAANEMPKSS